MTNVISFIEFHLKCKPSCSFLFYCLFKSCFTFYSCFFHPHLFFCATCFCLLCYACNIPPTSCHLSYIWRQLNRSTEMWGICVGYRFFFFLFSSFLLLQPSILRNTFISLSLLNISFSLVVFQCGILIYSTSI